MIRSTLIAFSLLVAASATASAEQRSTVENGTYVQEREGAFAVLTPGERRMIRREQARVYAMERRFKADGRYTRSERRQVAAAQRQVNAHARSARAS